MQNHRTSYRRIAVQIAILASISFCVYLLYQPAVSAPIFFDTENNLTALENMSDFSDTKTFILSGEAGPLGRPISLLSFALQSQHWPANPDQLRQTNVFIHLATGVLVAWVAYLILLQYSRDTNRSSWAAIIAATLWLTSPVLASTSLFIIQRMTSLTVLVMMVGIIFHLYIRNYTKQNYILGFILLTLNLAIFTTIASLTKENGSLLPALILSIEILLLPSLSVQTRAKFKVWIAGFLALPTLIIFGIIISKASYSEATVLFRGFDSYERAITQTIILWEYIFNAVIPTMHQIGPFHDGYPVTRSMLELPAILSLTAWLVLIGAALFFRKKYPLLLFSVGWFLIAHLLESTLIPLELYFEHRNYLAFIGPLIALAYGLVSTKYQIKRLLMAGLFCYIGLTAFVLHQTTSLWGDPQKSSEFWLEHNPNSLRASLFFTEAAIKSGDIEKATRYIDEFAAESGHPALFYLQRLAIQCFYGLPRPQTGSIAAFEEKLAQSQHSVALVNYLPELRKIGIQTECEDLSDTKLADLAHAVLDSSRFGRFTRTRYAMHGLLGHIERDSGNHASAARHFKHSLSARRDPRILFFAVSSYLELAQYTAACEMLAYQRRNAPERWQIRSLWLNIVSMYESDVAKTAGHGSCQRLLRS